MQGNLISWIGLHSNFLNAGIANIFMTLCNKNLVLQKWDR